MGVGLKEVVPEPHQLDFDWRFSDATADVLAEILRDHNRILCVGAPFVFSRLDHTAETHYLVDSNPNYPKYLPESRNRIVSTSAGEFRLDVTFDAAIIDPPWYPEYYKSWCANVIRHLRLGGDLFLCMFPEQVRPTAGEERALIADLLKSIGELSKIPVDVRYDTPLFELETHAAIGEPVGIDWRLAELWHIKIRQKILASCPKVTECNERRWRRFQRGSQVVAIDESRLRGRAIFFESIYDASGQFVLQSVSRRHPPRKVVDLWTSRNRVCRFSGPPKCIQLFQAWAEGNSMIDKSIEIFGDGKEVQTVRALVTAMGLEGDDGTSAGASV